MGSMRHGYLFLRHLQSKAAVATDIAAKRYGTAFYKQLIEDNAPHVVEPPSVPNFQERSKQLFHTRSSFFARYYTVAELQEEIQKLEVKSQKSQEEIQKLEVKMEMEELGEEQKNLASRLKAMESHYNFVVLRGKDKGKILRFHELPPHARFL